MSGLGIQFGLQRFQNETLLNPIDYSGIITSLNFLTDTLDTVYDGTNPTLAGMETELDTINTEIITA